MRVLVCGGRDWSDRWLYEVLDKLHKEYAFDVVIEGDAKGADRMAGYWARKRKIDNLKFPADWNKYGKAAGTIRNQQMLDEGKPDLVVAFPTDRSRGTWHMIRIAQDAGVEVKVFD
jgi:hypothetical protein